jgi:hypothetical protein
MRWRRWWRRLVKRSRLATLLACLTILIISSSCSHRGAYLTLPKPPMPVAPVLHSQPTPSPPPAGEKGVWFPLKDAGALMIYLDKLKGKCREDDVVIERGNEYLKKH